MAKTIKIIELLNKIANEEEVPETVRYFHRISKLFELMLVCKENIIYKLDRDIIDLTDEVEIIEDEQEIDIQNIEDEDLFDNGQSFNDFPIVIKSYDDNFSRITKK